MILVDTSVWVQVFRRTKPVDLEAQVSIDEVVVCLPIVQEILQGFRDEAAFRLARESLAALPTIESPLSAEVFDDAVDLYRRARRAGLTIRSSIDCLIAACAIRHHVTVLHADRDFDALSKVSPLRVTRMAIR